MPMLPRTNSADADVYYRTWPVDHPWADVLFLHGLGEHSGLYHRLAFELGASGIRVSAIDQPGHGFSSGDRGQAAPVGVLAAAARRAADHLASNLPMFAIAHSMGTTGAARLALEPDSGFAGMILSACLLAPWTSEGEDAITLDALSADPFYLDQVVHSPFPLPDPDLDTFWSSELPTLWTSVDRPFGLPTLLLHGEVDPIVPVDVARRVAAVTESPLKVYPGIRHDLLNDVSHRAVAADIMAFIRSHAESS